MLYVHDGEGNEKSTISNKDYNAQPLNAHLSQTLIRNHNNVPPKTLGLSPCPCNRPP